MCNTFLLLLLVIYLNMNGYLFVLSGGGLCDCTNEIVFCKTQIGEINAVRFNHFMFIVCINLVDIAHMAIRLNKTMVKLSNLVGSNTL